VAVDTILLEDPAGNPVELFQPRAGYHERATSGPAAGARSIADAKTTTEEEEQ
jgi:hypothetical protein